jgi:hypothetical protein
MTHRVEGSRCPGPSLAASVLSHSLSLSLLLSLFMKDKDTAIARDAIPVSGTTRVPVFSRVLRLAGGALIQMWHESVYAHKCLLDVRVPAGGSGSLRWERRPGGWRLAGRYLPAGLPGSAAPPSGEIPRPVA